MIDVIKWDELDEEYKNKYNAAVEANDQFHNLVNQPLKKYLHCCFNQLDRTHRSSTLIITNLPTEELASLVFKYKAIKIFVLHHSVADQIRYKKKIESIFTMRAFW